MEYFCCVPVLMLNTAVLLLPRLFKGGRPNHLYITGEVPPSNMPCMCFEPPLDASPTPHCKITLDYVEVVQDEGGLDFVCMLACLMSVYFVYSIEFAKHVENTFLFVQHHLLHMKERESPLCIKRIDTLLSKY